MYGILAKLLFGKLLKDAEVKKRVFEALRHETTKTSTKLDDTAVDAVEVVWSVLADTLLK